PLVPLEASTPHLLRQVMRESVEVQLAALRASLETLSSQARSGDWHPQILESSAQQFTEVSRNVQALIDFCQPPKLHPETCRLSAVLHCATAPLTAKARQRVAVACESPSSLNVDTARLGHCLAQWIELVVEEGASQVLLIARGEGSKASLSLLSDESRNPHRIHELQRRLLEQEVIRMGGLATTHPREQGSLFTITFDSEATHQTLSAHEHEIQKLRSNKSSGEAA
ncbi:MAG: hypothetical protein AAF368_17210, partial [Planctomycetota bacterium]